MKYKKTFCAIENYFTTNETMNREQFTQIVNQINNKENNTPQPTTQNNNN